MATTPADKKVQAKGLKKVNTYQKVFSGPDGEWVLNDLMAAHGMLSISYRGDVNDMLIKEGERNAVLRLLKILNVDYVKLRERIKENEQSLED